MSYQHFAEPEGQSAEQRQINMDPREQQMYNPQPINVDSYEKIQPLPRRRRSRPWLWIIAVLVIAALLGIGASVGLGGFQNTVTETHTYTISSHPTLVINDDTGSITIHRGSANSQVTIQAIKHVPQFGFGSAPTVQYNQSGDTVTATGHSGNAGFLGGNVSFDVTLPENANLQVHTNTGSIDVSGVDGAMSLTTNTGSVTATQDALSGPSTLKSGTGSITFVGSIGSSGNYEFSTNTGSVDVTLPGNAAFHVDATTDTGSISSDFPGVNVQKHNAVSSEAHGDVGSSPNAQVTLKTNTGSIDLHRGA